MALTAPTNAFGVHSFTPYNRTTKLPYAIFKVLGSLEFNNTVERIKLEGGSLRYPWDEEFGRSDATLTLVIREIKPVQFLLMQGESPTERSAEASAGVESLVNSKGASVQSATTGIASVSVKSGSESDVKSGMYVVKAVSATTVDVYAVTDVDFNIGTDISYQDDSLKITASPLTITASTAVEIPNTGLELTGGSGTIAMTTDDTAYFYARAINTGSYTAEVGALDVPQEFGALFVAQKQSNGRLYTLECPRIKAGSLPLNFTEFEWSETSIEMSPLYDSDRGFVFKFDEINDSSTT